MTNRKSKDVYIALMGLTGAGKSSFINHCTKHEVTVGDGLQACTAKVEVYSFKYSPGVTIHLVDTPGFDDTNRQDSDVLRDISAWLSKSYTEKVLLNGFEAEEGITALELSLCNSYLICASTEGHIHWPEVWSAHMPYDGIEMRLLARPVVNKMYSIMTCVQFGPSSKIAFGLDNGNVVRGTVAKSGEIEEQRLLTTPGTSVNSMFWTSDSRLLVGTRTGIFIVGSDDHFKQVTQTDLDFDRECWSLHLGSGVKVCGTLHDQGSYYEEQDDGYVVVRHSRQAVAVRVPADVSLESESRRREVAVVHHACIAVYDCVR